MKDTYGKLTALFVYNPNYFHTNSTKRVQIEFGLGKEVSVSAIIGIPTLKQWKSSISFEGKFLTSPLFQKKISLIYKPAKPSSVTFEYKKNHLTYRSYIIRSNPSNEYKSVHSQYKCKITRKTSLHFHHSVMIAKHLEWAKPCSIT